MEGGRGGKRGGLMAAGVFSTGLCPDGDQQQRRKKTTEKKC